ncbi:tripartite tricarboxylate transporter TctB family protein [Rhizobium sp. L1K21]|uniref:tripartite tricarboxylate transporter TctB family protein n=1 Tax=Rhizobium sp. L1K21 TaxID=2954933 RepID=UPI0020925BB4|nr:tripartite tricarboxylate transporter TctB family protein [Rhizobium sp. L1K21]MCO6185237.1 tripartite tricarboxylate transporter TctB family protein [Rhizobium sp. L1K21]
MSDRILGGIGLLVAAFYIWQSTLVELSFITDPVGPKTFPIMIGIVLALASLAMIFSPDANPHWPQAAKLLEIGISAAVMVAYVYLLPAAGFVIATALAAAFLSWRLGAEPLRGVIAGVAISVGIYVVFHLILGLSLAKGPLGF